MSNHNELEALTVEQLAEYYYRCRNEIEDNPGESIVIESACPLSPVVQVRLRVDEAEQVSESYRKPRSGLKNRLEEE